MVGLHPGWGADVADQPGAESAEDPHDRRSRRRTATFRPATPGSRAPARARCSRRGAPSWRAAAAPTGCPTARRPPAAGCRPVRAGCPGHLVDGLDDVEQCDEGDDRGAADHPRRPLLRVRRADLVPTRRHCQPFRSPSRLPARADALGGERARQHVAVGRYPGDRSRRPARRPAPRSARQSAAAAPIARRQLGLRRHRSRGVGERAPPRRRRSTARTRCPRRAACATAAWCGPARPARRRPPACRRPCSAPRRWRRRRSWCSAATVRRRARRTPRSARPAAASARTRAIEVGHPRQPGAAGRRRCPPSSPRRRRRR